MDHCGSRMANQLKIGKVKASLYKQPRYTTLSTAYGLLPI